MEDANLGHVFCLLVTPQFSYESKCICKMLNSDFLPADTDQNPVCGQVWGTKGRPLDREGEVVRSR